MKYTILVYETEAAFSSRTDERRREGYWGAYRAYTQALQAAGVMVGGAGLQPPPLGTTVRQRDGKRQVQDGPYAETKEQLGGFYLIEARDLNDAIQVAAKIPSARLGSVEVRPIVEFSKP